MNENDIKKIINDIICDMTSIHEIDSSMTLEYDLKMNSLDIVEFIISLEDTFNLKILDADEQIFFDKCTVSRVYEFIKKKLNI